MEDKYIERQVERLIGVYGKDELVMYLRHKIMMKDIEIGQLKDAIDEFRQVHDDIETKTQLRKKIKTLEKTVDDLLQKIHTKAL